MLRTATKLFACIGLIAGLVYLYYTEIKPVVIFGLRSDYAHAIPFQRFPRDSRACGLNPAGNATATFTRNGRQVFTLTPIKIPFSRPIGRRINRCGSA